MIKLVFIKDKEIFSVACEDSLSKKVISKFKSAGFELESTWYYIKEVDSADCIINGFGSSAERKIDYSIPCNQILAEVIKFCEKVN